MQSLHSAALFALISALLPACGGAEGHSGIDEGTPGEDAELTAAQSPGSSSSMDEAELEDLLASATPMEVVAEVESDDQSIQFVAAHGLSPHGADIGIAVQTTRGAPDRVTPLLVDGATALEVYLTFAPEGAEPPSLLVENHPVAAELEGRETEVRAYSKLPTVGSSIQLDEATCSSMSNFLDHAEANLIDNSIVSDQDPGIHNVNKTATSSSSRDVNIYMCNHSSNDSCNRDRKIGIVYATSGQGGGAVHNALVTDCRIFSFNWTSRSANTTYGITARDGCLPGLVNGNEICTPANVTSYLAIGWDQ